MFGIISNRTQIKTEIKNKMTEQTQESLKKVLSVWDNVFFIKFMGLRFPQETSISYIEEWKTRIQNYKIGTMDNETRQAYQESLSFMLKNY